MLNPPFKVTNQRCGHYNLPRFLVFTLQFWIIIFARGLWRPSLRFMEAIIDHCLKNVNHFVIGNPTKSKVTIFNLSQG